MKQAEQQFEYGLNQRVPFLKSVLFGLQWAALIISSMIILGKVVGDLHSSDPLARIIYLQKLLFLHATTLVCQVLWGHRLPLIVGPSSVLLIGIIASQGFGLSAIHSSVMIGGLFVAILGVSGYLRYFQRLFTTNVVAVVLLLIAFTLTPTIRDLMTDSRTGINPLHSLFFGFALVFLVFLCHGLLRETLKSTLVIWAVIGGSVLYYLVFPAAQGEDLFSGGPWVSHFFQHMTLHVTIHPGVLLSFVFCFMALTINDLSSIQAVMELIEPKDTEDRMARGISFTGLANIACGFFGVIGPVNYSLSPGVMMSTKCASRFTLLPAAAIMVILSFFPAATGFVANVPNVVIGAVLAYVLTMQIAAGLFVALRDAEGGGFQFENGLIIGLSILLGTMIAFLPEQILSTLPSFLRPVLGNGFVVGVVTALLLDHVILRR